jgi:hypothetical protein
MCETVNLPGHGDGGDLAPEDGDALAEDEPAEIARPRQGAKVY